MNTQCPKCKASHKVTEELQGKKVICSKCKESFICSTIPKSPPQKQDHSPTVNEPEKCANCGRVINKLEQAYLYQKNVVCSNCDETLRNQSVKAPPQPFKVEQTKSMSGLGVSRQQKWHRLTP